MSTTPHTSVCAPVTGRGRHLLGTQTTETPVRISDKPRDECGVLGLSTPHGEGVAQLAFFGLFALQHHIDPETGKQAANMIKMMMCI